MIWIILAIIIVLLGSAAYAGVSAAPWVPAWKKDYPRIARLLDLDEGSRFIELGCGTAGLCRYLKKNTRARISGIEISIIQWLVVKTLCLTRKNGSVNILFGNLWKIDLSGYTHIFIFLMPDAYEKIREKFSRELSSGTKIVTYVWSIPEWTPVKIDKEKGNINLFLYEV